MEDQNFVFAPVGKEIMCISRGKGGSDSESSIKLSFEYGAKGIELFADGTAQTWGDYEPKGAAEEFWRAVSQVVKLSNPKGSA